MEFTAEVIAASFRTEGQKLALGEKCLKSLSRRTPPLAASMQETNAEAKAGLQKQRQRKSGETRTDAKTQHEIGPKI